MKTIVKTKMRFDQVEIFVDNIKEKKNDIK